LADPNPKKDTTVVYDIHVYLKQDGRGANIADVAGSWDVVRVTGPHKARGM
jgi:hypothetical protein